MYLLAVLATAFVASIATADANVASCQKAVLGAGPADWKQQATTAGPVGVFRHPLGQMSRTASGDLVTKMPILVEGQTPVTVSVPSRLRHRVFLYYGRVIGRNGQPTTSFSGSPGYGETEFRPCPGRPRTPWPGGIRVKGFEPVHLTVTVEDRSDPLALRLGRPRLYSGG